MVKMVQTAQQGNFDKARQLHYQLLPIMNACFKEGSPSGIKTFLKAQGKIESFVRLPMVDVSPALKKEIESLII